MPTLTPKLRQEYASLWARCKPSPSRLPEAQRIAAKIILNRDRYETVAQKTGVPWWVIAGLHNLEASLSFTCHLHNGDPLTKRTTHVPANRPKGKPPFTWEESAIDALTYDQLTDWTDWSFPGALYKAEGFNGFGYRHKGIRSPYLWAGSNLEQPGKFVADGVWDPKATSSQIGIGTLWKVLDPLRLTGQTPKPLEYRLVLPDGTKVPCALKQVKGQEPYLIVAVRPLVEGLGYELDTADWPIVRVIHA